MSKSHKLVVRIDDETLAGLDRLAAEFECTREHLATTALMRFVNEELWAKPPAQDDPLANLPPYVDPDPLARALDDAERRAAEALEAYLKPAEDDIAAGRVIDHGDFMREMRQRYRSRDAA